MDDDPCGHCPNSIHSAEDPTTGLLSTKTCVEKSRKWIIPNKSTIKGPFGLSQNKSNLAVLGVI